MNERCLFEIALLAAALVRTCSIGSSKGLHFFSSIGLNQYMIVMEQPIQISAVYKLLLLSSPVRFTLGRHAVVAGETSLIHAPGDVSCCSAGSSKG